MAQYKNMFNVDLNGDNAPVMLRQMIAEGNNAANRIGAIVTDNGVDVSLGGSCSGKVVRADGVTVILSGTVEGNKAFIVLDGNSYAVPGAIEVTVNWTSGNNVTTLLKAYGIVERTQTGSVIPSGTPINIDTILELLEDISEDRIFTTDTTIITGDGTTSAIADHANVQANKLYRFQLTTPMSWLPASYPTNAKIVYFLSITMPFTLGRSSVTEVLFDDRLHVLYTRQRQPASASFDSWKQNIEDFKTDSTIIAGDGTTSSIANHNNVKPNTLYRLQLTTKASWMPSDYVANGSIRYLIDITHPFNSYVAVVELILDEFFRIMWCRSAQPNGTFGDWYAQKDGRFVVTVSPGTDTLQSAVALAVYEGNADVVLLPGEHIISNFSGNGISIGNGVRVIGSPDAVIKAYSDTGNQYYSPFFAGAGDFELIGVNIDAKNVRYCVHDDPPAASASTPARHTYKDCSFYIDNTENELWPNHQCIGGGMGMHTTIDVENCYFEAAAPDSELGLLSYHNNGEANAQGLIFVKDSEFIGAEGTARFGWYGTSTKITKCFVVGCKMGHAPVIRAETVQSTIENMELVQWGNEIGSDTLTVSITTTTYTLAASRDYLNIPVVAGKTLISAYLVGYDSDALVIRGFVVNGSNYSLFFNKSLSASKDITVCLVFANG